MIVYGRNAVREALCGRRAKTAGEVLAIDAVARESWLAGRNVRRANALDIERACGSPEHQGICVAVGEFPYAGTDELLLKDDCFILALDEVQDPQNLGAICRTAECVGVTGVVICERRAAAVSPAVCRASAGAVEHLRIARAANLTDFLEAAKRRGCWCYGAAAVEGAVPYDEPDYTGGLVAVLGAEGRGLRPRVAANCDALIGLPLRGRIGSLNVSAAGAVLLYEMLQRRTALDSTP
jgi:23S rRNA (guanosine2251-2'-O)-methyltransferase